jgi:FkbM family methyltransferase
MIKDAANAVLRKFHIELRSVYSGGRLFPESFHHLKRVLSEGRATVIDIGVADGTPDLYSAFPAPAYAYLLVEANPLYAEDLKRLGNMLSAKTESVFCGDHDGEESFAPKKGKDAGKASKYSRRNAQDEERVNIPCFTLDTLAKKHSLSAPFIIKVDVEGAELDVLRGATTTLSKTEAVIIEAPVVLRKEGASSFGEIVRFLHERGFAVFDIAEMSYHQKSGFLNLTNIIFVRTDNRVWREASVSKK